MKTSHTSTVALVAFLLSCVAGCSSDDVDRREELNAHRSEWKAKTPSKYVVVTCGTGFSPPSCVRAAVEDGSVRAAQTSTFRRTPLTEANPAEVKEPLGELFDQAQRFADGEKCELRLDFDARYGFLSSYSADCGEEGEGRRVECFAPDTVDLGACPYEVAAPPAAL